MDLTNTLLYAAGKKGLENIKTVGSYIGKAEDWLDDKLGVNSQTPQMKEAIDTAINFSPMGVGTVVGKGLKGLTMAKQKLYRGDPAPLSLKNYNPNSGIEAGKELGQSMAEGPGIYFTTNKKNAFGYGKNITEANLQKGSKIIDKAEKKFTINQIDKMLSDVDNETLDTALSNWDENKNIARKMIIDSIYEADTPIDQLMGIWSDVYYHQNPDKYMALMSKHNIAGIEVPKDGLSHYVIYDKSKLSNIKQTAEDFLDK